MIKNQTILPSKSWATYEKSIRSHGEKRSTADAENDEFLCSLGFLETDGRLAAAGQSYFTARFIRNDSDLARDIFQKCLVDYPPAGAILQSLRGVKGANRVIAETVLRSQGFEEGLTDRQIGALLMLMNAAGLITYQKRRGEITVDVDPALQSELPVNLFVAPTTPFANRVWLRRILSECERFIYWLDKHFLPVAFEAVWEAVNGNRIDEMRILSLRLPDNSGRRGLRDYRNLRDELYNRGVNLEWRTLESQDFRDTHDRWIIAANTARNVPNVGAIYSGQHSELHVTDRREELKCLFEQYWTKGKIIM